MAKNPYSNRSGGGPRRDVSSGRKLAYYLGAGITLLGLISFISVFFTAVSGDPFENLGKGPQFMKPAIIGMVLIVVGGFIRGIGARGLAGSGVVLDPEKAREDVEPWSRMAGGIVKDALDEGEIRLGQAGGNERDFDEKLRKLHQLYKDGILTQEEYEKEKREILDNN